MEILDKIIIDADAWVAVAWALDILVVSYLLYILFLLIRGTRTVPMALGLIFVLILYVFSNYFKLSTTFLILDQFKEIAVIFALIIFQDDIRKALVRMGRFAWFSKKQHTQVIGEVIRAIYNLASHRLGAIIVFERDGSLNEYLENGTPLDAQVSNELIYATFIPRMENLLHDGAMVIKNYRIREAGSILPLSTNPNLDKKLGTRHRAALGITEVTDAVSVVVSEERGTVSVCWGGRMRKNLSENELRDKLFDILSREKAKPAETDDTKKKNTPSGDTDDTRKDDDPISEAP